MTIGVVLVTYNASDIIIECLESLVASKDVDLRILVVDNASADDTPEVLRRWADGINDASVTRIASPNEVALKSPKQLVEDPARIVHLTKGEIGLLALSENLGFAAGVNAGLKMLEVNPDVAFFWILNPDCVVPPTTARKLEDRADASGRFGVIGGRVYYIEDAEIIQSDGGWVNRWTGICTPRNLGKKASDALIETGPPLDFIGGGHMLVSRDFIAAAGHMPEDYFLYYEEVDWCLRRGDLPLIFDPEAMVYHHGGHSIGSPTVARGPSALSTYFLNRGRMKFIARHWPLAWPIAWLYSFTRAARCILRGQQAAGWAAMRGIAGLPPTPAILHRLGRKSLPK